VLSSIADIAIAATLAVGGIAMTPLPIRPVAGALVGAVVFAFVLDLIKVPVFSRLGIARKAANQQEPHTTQCQATTQATTKAAADLTARISKRAYALYEQGGRKDGAAVQHWAQAQAQAEAEVRKDSVE
jgi:hypothetical protein